MTKTSIEWTNRTWNPVSGCTWVSPGCDNCYARVMGTRQSGIKGNPRYGHPFSDVMCHEDRLNQPLCWKKPAMVFVNSMSDLFHDAVPTDFIAEVWAVMAACRGRHTFQVLTKRPGRMALLLRNSAFQDRVTYLLGTNYKRVHGIAQRFDGLENVWIGVTVENQEQAAARIPLLLNTPAAVRWLSVEPMLEPIDINVPIPEVCGILDPIDWVVCGGESGKKARPFHVGWARDLRDQCHKANIPFFMKQIGAKAYQSEKDDESGVVVPGRIETVHTKGADPLEWPEDLRVRQWPNKKGGHN